MTTENNIENSQSPVVKTKANEKPMCGLILVTLIIGLLIGGMIGAVTAPYIFENQPAANGLTDSDKNFIINIAAAVAIKDENSAFTIGNALYKNDVELYKILFDMNKRC